MRSDVIAKVNLKKATKNKCTFQLHCAVSFFLTYVVCITFFFVWQFALF